MEIKGKHFRAEVPKALKNMEHQKSSASANSGGSAPFMAGTQSSAGQSLSQLRATRTQSDAHQKLCQSAGEPPGQTAPSSREKL